MILGSHKSDNSNNFTGIPKIHLECFVIDGSIANCS